MTSVTKRWSHRGQLPSWNRPGLCKRTGSDVRSLTKDRLSPLSLDQGSGALENGLGCGTSSLIESGAQPTRVVQLEKNIVFLKQQHHDTLQQLHKEIERLKIENRELNFKLIMCRCGRSASRANNRRLRKVNHEDAEPGAPNGDLHAIFLEEEIRGLKNSLAAEKNKNNRLMRVIEKKVLEKQKSSSCSYDQSDNESTSGVMPHTSLVGNIQPVLSGESGPSTLEECETIIKHLQTKNNQQAHELVQIKADLRDVLYSHKWTPDAYLMARAYVSDDKESEGTSNDPDALPKLVPESSRKTLERAYQRVKEEVTLPALRPRMPSMVAERLRRAQAVRGRLGRSLL